MKKTTTMYWREMAQLLYLLWFKPITLREQMNGEAGDPKLLRISLVTIWRKQEVRHAFWGNESLLRLLGQLLLGNLLLLLIVTPLLAGLSDLTGLTAWMGGGGYSQRVAFGVIFGVMYGVAGGVMYGMAGGVAYGVAYGVPFGVALGIAASVAYGTPGGVAYGVPLGVALGIAASVASGVASGVVGGIVLGVVLSVAFGMVLGMAYGVAFGVAFFRLPQTPLWGVYALWQWWQAGQSERYARRSFSRSVVYLDELIYLPLLFFDRFLTRCMIANPEQAMEMLTVTAGSTGQKWAVALAASQWTATAGEAAENLPALTHPAQRADSVADIVMNLPRKEKLSRLLRDFATVGNSLAHINDAHTPAVATQVLNRNRADLDTLKTSANLLKRPELATMAGHWQRLIRAYAEQLEQAPHQVLAGAYQAGAALETDSSLFRGRGALFAIASEVYANPQRAETLLLIAQQRMGKSSALMQFPAQLPDAHVIIIDCQRFVSGEGDDLFAIGMTAAIIHEEKRRLGGVRLSPLTEEEVGKHPLHRLNGWLETYADKAGRKKRVLFCLDEFDKLIDSVAAGKLSRDVLGLLRGLSQAQGWMVLYSGQYELDNHTLEFAEYLKNVRRVRVSYLKADEARDLLTHPVPDFALTWEAEAVERALYWSGCQPYLLQMIGSQVVDLLSPLDRRTVTAVDIEELLPTYFDAGRYYFHSIEKFFSADEMQALDDIARTGSTSAANGLLRRLVDREYVEKGDGGVWRFRVPLLAEWLRRDG